MMVRSTRPGGFFEHGGWRWGLALLLVVLSCQGSGETRQQASGTPPLPGSGTALRPPGEEQPGIGEVPPALPDSGRAAYREILVRYQGSVGSAELKVVRTKEEARARAEEALRKVREEKGDFTAAVAEYSEGRSTDRDGYHAPFPRGGRPKAIEDAVFALAVGEISDIVETPAGFHIFLREEGTNYRGYLLLVSHAEAGGNARTRAQAEALAARLHERIIAHPDSLPDLARTYSDGPRAQIGGNLGIFNRYTHGTEVGDAAAKLEAGHISRVFETKDGYAILLRVE